MLIAYDNMFRAPPEKLGETTEFSAHSHSRIMVCMTTEDFRVEHKDGKTSVHLSRHLTHAQARELATAMLARVDALELQEKQRVGVYGTTVTPDGSVVNVVNVKNNMDEPVVGSRE